MSVIALALLVSCMPPDVPAPMQRALALADAASIRARLKFLSDDVCEGRDPGSRGSRIAAQYLVEQMKEIGLAPGMPDGTWFQPVPMTSIGTDLATSTVRLISKGEAFPMTFRDEFVATDESQEERADVDVDVVFVGYGIASKAQNWDDYKSVDVRGKVLLMLVNDPPSDDPKVFGGKALTYFGRWTYKFEEAARRGAVGAILMHRDSMAGYDWSVVKNSWGRPRPYVTGETDARLKMAAWISEPRLRQVLKPLGADVDEMIAAAGRPDFKPRPLDLRVKATIVSKLTTLDSVNVLGLLEGGAKKDEVVVCTSHYDHLGKRAEDPGDNVYNGALDNASGCAALFEVARMSKALPEPPARSILFAFVTAEESGLKGSEYFVLHPTFPRQKIAANVNLDGVTVNGVPADYVAMGFDRSTLKPVMEEVAKQFDVALAPDPKPDLGHFYRSDHFNFAKAGIPVIYLTAGFTFRDKPLTWGREQSDEYLKLRYHRPTDQYEPTWDLMGAVQTARMTAVLTWRIAGLAEMPRYLPGDEFAVR